MTRFPTRLLTFALLVSCLLMPLSASAEYDFDSMTLEEVKNLKDAAASYYEDMTKVSSEASNAIETLISESVGKHCNGKVSTPLFGYDIKRERDIYTLSDTVKVKDANNKTVKHEVEAVFLDNGMMSFTKLVIDGTVLIDINPEDVPGVEYLAVTAKKMIDDLEKNALNAKEQYTGKYVAVTGLISTIDSSGEYITLAPDEYSFMTIHCSIESKDVLEKVKKVTNNQKITVYGKITSVGEVLGYYLDIHDIK